MKLSKTSKNKVSKMALYAKIYKTDFRKKIRHDTLEPKLVISGLCTASSFCAKLGEVNASYIHCENMTRIASKIFV